MIAGGRYHAWRAVYITTDARVPPAVLEFLAADVAHARRAAPVAFLQTYGVPPASAGFRLADLTDLGAPNLES